MVSCSVLNCDVTYNNNSNKETFHRFPVNAVVREKWIRIINRIGWKPQKNSMVCSRHFRCNCFIQRNHRRILKKGSIPTEFVPVKIKPKRPVTSYVYRDISPEPLTPQPAFLMQRMNKLINKCWQLKQKVNKKQQDIRNLRAKTIRLHKRLVRAEKVIEELKKRPSIWEHLNDITAACNNETLLFVIERTNNKSSGELAQ